MDSPPAPAGNDVRVRFTGIDIPREELVRRIEARCRTMMQEGLIEETEALLKKGFPESCPALTGLGYPRVIAHIKGLLSKEDCLKLLVQDTSHYAKRQMTWFRREPNIKWKK